MKKKKRPGIERPFTFEELCSLAEKEAKNQSIPYFDELDYFSPLNNDNDWIEYLEANGIEVSVFSEILEEV